MLESKPSVAGTERHSIRPGRVKRAGGAVISASPGRFVPYGLKR